MPEVAESADVFLPINHLSPSQSMAHDNEATGRGIATLPVYASPFQLADDLLRLHELPSHPKSAVASFLTVLVLATRSMGIRVIASRRLRRNDNQERFQARSRLPCQHDCPRGAAPLVRMKSTLPTVGSGASGMSP